MTKYYYAIFRKTQEAVEVEFPDLQGCVTFGKDWEEALENAEDVLTAWLAHADPSFIKEPSAHDQLLPSLEGELVPIIINRKQLSSYHKLKRFNVIFSEDILSRVDAFRKRARLKRSAFLQKAAEEYLSQHEKLG
jgi:predicted RNase H-like HicB family nuclease